jgi:hypothetical protein
MTKVALFLLMSPSPGQAGTADSSGRFTSLTSLTWRSREQQQDAGTHRRTLPHLHLRRIRGGVVETMTSMGLVRFGKARAGLPASDWARVVRHNRDGREFSRHVRIFSRRKWC